jgi:hypothetical protein
MPDFRGGFGVLFVAFSFAGLLPRSPAASPIVRWRPSSASWAWLWRPILADAPKQRLHQVDDVADGGTLIGDDRRPPISYGFLSAPLYKLKR